MTQQHVNRLIQCLIIALEKGTIENTIGPIRRILPKKTNFAMITKEQVKEIETLLNNRPRKCLNYQTPLEVFREISVALDG